MAIHPDLRALRLLLRSASDSARAEEIALFAEAGAASGTLVHGQAMDAGQIAIRVRSDATTAAQLIEYTIDGGTTWTAYLGVVDAAASLVATTIEAALAELATPLTLTPGAESGNAIDVVIAGPAHVAQYVASVLDVDLVQGLVADWTLAEVGAGAEVSTSARPRLLFTTSAGGAATIRVTDVSGVYAGTVYLHVQEAGASAGAKPGPSAIVALTFA
jgi:hypothetical protein